MSTPPFKIPRIPHDRFSSFHLCDLFIGYFQLSAVALSCLRHTWRQPEPVSSRPASPRLSIAGVKLRPPRAPIRIRNLAHRRPADSPFRRTEHPPQRPKLPFLRRDRLVSESTAGGTRRMEEKRAARAHRRRSWRTWSWRADARG